MLDNETKRRIDTARDILVGKVPDPKSQVEQITIALIYKFMDDMDAEAEELGGVRTFFAGEFEKYSWVKLLASGMGGFEMLALYGEAISKMPENPGIPLLFRDIFKNAYLPYRDPETLKSFLKIINDFSYDHSERLGDAFEYLLSVLGSQGDAGQFRTPRHIIDFMVAVIAPGKNETLLDPACGTAGFLISAYKYVLAAHAHNGRRGAGLTPDERTRLLNNIKGYDISPDMVRLSLVNLYLHGFSDPHIAEYDTLTSTDKWNEYADIIMANPPFMSPKGGIRPHNRFSIQSSRSEVLFVDYIAEHLSPIGRAAVIVPEGIIFQSGTAYKSLRKMLVENTLVGVISLPAGVFQPYSGVKTSILWLDKSLAKKTDQIVFVKIENDGFDLGAQRREVKQNDLPAALRGIIAYKTSVVNGQTFESDAYPNVTVVVKAEIAANGDYNLSGERYKKTLQPVHLEWPIVKLGDVCTFMTGGTPTSTVKEYYEGGNIPWLVSGDIHKGQIFDCEGRITERGVDSSNAKYLPKDSVLIALNGQGKTRGTVAILRMENATCNQSLVSINPIDKNHLLSEFLFYQLKSLYQEIRNITGDNQRSGLNIPIVKSIQIPLPPLDVQAEIVAEIEGYQKIIDGARQVLEAYRPRIEIDPAWPVVQLGEVCVIKGGYAFKSNDFTNSGIQVIKMGNVKPLFFDADNKPSFLPIDFRDRYEDYILKAGDILISMTGTIGKTDYGNVCIIDKEKEYLLNQRVGKFFFTTKNVNRKFIYYLANQYFFKESILKNSAGGVRQANISSQQIESIKILLPDLATQERIVAQIEREKALVKANRELIEIFEQKIKGRIAKVWGE